MRGVVGLCLSPVAAETILAMPPPSEWPVLHTHKDAGCGSEAPRARAGVELSAHALVMRACHQVGPKLRHLQHDFALLGHGEGVRGDAGVVEGLLALALTTRRVHRIDQPSDWLLGQ